MQTNLYLERMRTNTYRIEFRMTLNFCENQEDFKLQYNQI
jgi:hypothetical protein